MTHLTSSGQVKKIFIAAGEVSGDIHAANLINSLKKIGPGLSFFGIGGEKMSGAGVELIERMDRLSIIGIWEVFSKLAEILKLYLKIIKKIRTEKPTLAILIDYPGFNLLLARALKKNKIPVIYYITPQIWAWGAGRIHLIKRYVDKAIVILKFEEDLFRKYGIDAAFVGHPLLDSKKETPALNKKSAGLDQSKFTIALLPGSRESEIKTLFPLMLKAAELILKEKDAQFVLLKNSSVPSELYDGILASARVKIAVIKDNTSGCLSVSDFVLTCSGTATLECAIAEKPLVITYKTSFVTAALFRAFGKIPFIGLVNIIAGKKIVPEILQEDATPEKLAREVGALVSSPERIDTQIRNLKKVKAELGSPGGAARAADIIKRVLNANSRESNADSRE